MRRIILLLLALVLAAGASSAEASALASYDLYEWHPNSDADWATDHLTASKTGSYTFHYSTPGAHSGGIYLDYEINEPLNTYFNEWGAAAGSAPQGLTWEIDEPGYSDKGYTGDIYYNFMDNLLDNTIFNGFFAGPEDVTMAMLWNFALDPGYTADLTFTASLAQPTSGFYLAQYDGPDGEDPIYLSAQLKTEMGGPEPVPEPSTLFLLGAGLLAVGIRARSRR